MLLPAPAEMGYKETVNAPWIIERQLFPNIVVVPTLFEQ